MFTGIIAAVGQIESIEPLETGIRLTLHAGGLDLSDVALGDSIALNGACMTVIECTETTFTVEVSKESLTCTVGLDRVGNRLNLEKALRLADRLGGHLVSGHVDGLGTVTALNPIGESLELKIALPDTLHKYLAAKGSIVVNGVSLTTNSVENGECSINLIAHTQQVTTLGTLKVKDQVNIEVDLIARYLENLLKGRV